MKANAHDEAFAMSSPLLIAKGLHTNVRATHECQTYAALLFKTLFPEGPRDSLFPAPELVKISLTLTVLFADHHPKPPKKELTVSPKIHLAAISVVLGTFWPTHPPLCCHWFRPWALLGSTCLPCSLCPELLSLEATVTSPPGAVQPAITPDPPPPIDKC